ncbi:MAG: YchJ family metal-binding protein [Arthrobacter sp.]|uniref:YchJ family protein n=1 Tax=Arthrobacter sp. TaxID=1667 RepID=UPI0034867381
MTDRHDAEPPGPRSSPAGRCPCLSGETYGRCCGAFHAGFAEGVWPATAEALMRSRFSAFAAGRPDYLLATWHASTRPAELRLDDGVAWTRLEILRREAGGPFDADGVVEFAAHYRDGAGRGVQREASRFVREGGRWYYLDGR